jgi:bacillithiol biosynthesis cysteine-adding enzyme BshC
MRLHTGFLPYQSIDSYFSPIVQDYLAAEAGLRAYYRFLPDIDGVQAAIQQRERTHTPREELVAYLKGQYAELEVNDTLINNIESLGRKDCFTVTAAHQPNLFTGPLYFVYKILHAIALTKELSILLPQYTFVPVYYMGSEDADKQELNHFTVDGKKYEWHTGQTGAFGRMLIDKEVEHIISALQGHLGVLPFGKEAIDLIKQSYFVGEDIQTATLKLVNKLFGQYGLVVVIPDAPVVKSLFIPVIKNELKNQFSRDALNKTIKDLRHKYKVQATGRDINLFYLHKNRRDRIERTNSGYQVVDTNIQFTYDTLMNEVEKFPERFSPNVVLRGVLQETILPNIIFIGGGGELGYWLELEQVFKEANVPYPLLILRNSFLLLNERQAEIKNKLNLNDGGLFKNTDALIQQWVTEKESWPNDLQVQRRALEDVYNRIRQIAAEKDQTLNNHTEALRAIAVKKIDALHQKLMRVSKKSHEANIRQLVNLMNQLFPGGNLQERVESIWGFYARYGPALIEALLENSKGLDMRFGIFVCNKNPEKG